MDEKNWFKHNDRRYKRIWKEKKGDKIWAKQEKNVINAKDKKWK